MTPSASARVAHLVDEAWRLVYLDPPLVARLSEEAIALSATAPMHPLRGWALFHRAFALLRTGEAEAGDEALAQARDVFAAQAERAGLALCDEYRGVRLRLLGRYDEAWALLCGLDERQDVQRTPVHRYMHHNSLANCAAAMGRMEDALREFHRAHAAAREVRESPGALISACVNLGGYHCDLFNFEDAIALLLDARRLALDHGAAASLTFACVNLMEAYDGAGLREEARALADFMCEHETALQPGALQRFAVTVALGLVNGGDIGRAQQWLDRGISTLVGAEGDMQTEWTYCQARCQLARGEPAAARALLESRLASADEAALVALPHMAWRLVKTAADACEALGDTAAALGHFRRAQALYETLVGRSSRARFIALQAAQQIEQAQRERDLARQAQAASEADRARLAELNAALQAKIGEAEALHAQLREQAVRDALTGLHNRRYLFEAGPPALKLALRQGTVLSLALLDLDHFKRLNDTHGHDLGDRALQAVGALLAQRMRGSDIVCRHGGEEFVLLLPGAAAAEARALLGDRLRQLGELTLALPNRAPVQGLSFSAGIAELGADGQSLDELLMRADARLYAAKAAGRAQVVSA